MTQTSKPQRIHGIDALRAIAMILGILLHATIAYKTEPLPNWPNDEGNTHIAFDAVYFFIHSFRMPLFYMIAGYFCRFLYYRIGEREFIRHRWKRIALPFILSLIIILPFTLYPFLVDYYNSLEPAPAEGVYLAAFKRLIGWNGMAHLWFLYYLLIYYAVVIAGMRIYRAVVKEKSQNQQKTTGAGLWGIAVLTISVFVILLMVPELFLHVDTGIIPAPPYLAFFFVFFAAGWWINRNPSPFFNNMQRNAISLTVAGTLIAIVVFWLQHSGKLVDVNAFRAAKFLIALQCILLVTGITGIFLKYSKSESKTWRYVSDASYWMYLIHLGLIAGMQVGFEDSAFPGWLRFPTVLCITLIITLVTYHYWIRYTIVGRYLHGPRERNSGKVEKIVLKST